MPLPNIRMNEWKFGEPKITINQNANQTILSNELYPNRLILRAAINHYFHLNLACCYFLYPPPFPFHLNYRLNMPMGLILYYYFTVYFPKYSRLNFHKNAEKRFHLITNFILQIIQKRNSISELNQPNVCLFVLL